MENARIGILGNGQIGQACFHMANTMDGVYRCISYDETNLDIEKLSKESIRSQLVHDKIDIVVNCLPFHLNEKVALALPMGVHYVDFTEDDVMSEKVRNIFRIREQKSVFCVTKCGVAPGLVNYVGNMLVKKVLRPDKLMVSVGALPRSINMDPKKNYNLSWSVAGVVNEYMNKCHIRKGGEWFVDPLTEIEQFIIEGITYEAAHTSGGVGDLVKDHPRIYDVCYKTLRYPGHFDYVKDLIEANKNMSSEWISHVFMDHFPFCKQDTVVMYAECSGYSTPLYTKENSVTQVTQKKTRETFSTFFGGIDGFSAIQTVTAASGMAVVEMIQSGALAESPDNGYTLGHKDISLETFMQTRTVEKYFVGTGGFFKFPL